MRIHHRPRRSSICSPMSHRRMNYYVLLAVITSIALTLRLAALHFTWFNTDSYNYFLMADAILARHPISLFPNGYPFLIVLVKLVAGPKFPLVLVLISVTVSTLTVVLTAETTRVLTGVEKAGLVAGAVVALYPNQINYARYILTEAPTAFLLILSLWLLVNRKYFISGLVLYLAILFRSTIWPALPLIIITWIYFKPNERLLRYLFGFLLGFVSYKICELAGVCAPPGNLSGNLLLAVASYSNNLLFSTAMFSAEQIAHPLKTYVSFAFSHPLIFIVQRLDSYWELWGFWPLDNERGIVSKVAIGVRFPLLLLGVLGFWRHKDFYRSMLLIPAVATTMVHVMFYSTPRYTCPIEPLLVILATCCVIAPSPVDSLSPMR